MTVHRAVYGATALAISLLFACSSGPSGDAGAWDEALRRSKRIAVKVTPSQVEVLEAGTVTFAATVTNAADTSVTWSVVEPTGCGTVSPAGVYTAPAVPATCHVLARSDADPSRTASATATVVAAPNVPTGPPPPAASTVAVAVTPATGAVDGCGVLAFSATVTGTANTAVTWSVQEGSAGGTISAAGVYTAPASAGTYHAVATSVADATKSAVATISVVERVLSVVVSPATTTVDAGGTAQFTATVTTTCGSFASTGSVGAN